MVQVGEFDTFWQLGLRLFLYTNTVHVLGVFLNLANT